MLARLRALRSDLIDPTIAVHNGRVVKRTGDGAIDRLPRFSTNEASSDIGRSKASVPARGYGPQALRAGNCLRTPAMTSISLLR